MKVLVACEYSGTVRDAFIARGHDAASCDVLPTEREGPHYQCDVRNIIHRDWDLVIAHPPCTYLANSGVSWLFKDDSRWESLREGAAFFRVFMELDHVPRVAVENPIMHKYARELIGRGHDCTIQPWQFGHGESKRTCFWLKGIPPLIPTHIPDDLFAEPEPDGREQRLHKLPPSPDRWKERSRTYQGVAEAMADQWGMS